MTNVYLSDFCFSEKYYQNHTRLTGTFVLNFHASECICKKCILLPLLETIN